MSRKLYEADGPDGLGEVSAYDPHSTGTRPAGLGEKRLLTRHPCSQVMEAAEACTNPAPHAAEDA